jgi:glycosyltransferase involved in cell wall biosynthesis
MIDGKKIIVVMPAYNAENTLEKTYGEIPFEIVDDVVLVDDKSSDNTSELGKKIGIKHIIVHEKNKGYGGNQKSCQYTPKLIHSISYLIANGVYPVVLGSRILGNGALKGGMPIYKYIANRFLTLTQNILVGQKLSEYHTGYRAFSKEVLESIKYNENSDDFVFDNQMLSQIIYKKFEIAEITCPTKYFDEASSINFKRSMTYGFGVLSTSFKHFFTRIGLYNWKLLK